VSNKVVRHSLAYLSVQKWLVGDVKVKVKVNVDLYSASSWTHL